MASILEKAFVVSRETKYIEFKEKWDPQSEQDWCEILKDIIAIANSGGGVILVGVNNKGVPTCCDIQPAIALDIADVSNKIYKYTHVNFSEIEITGGRKGNADIACVLIGPTEFPVVFCKPGTYAIGDGKQKTAFAQGTLYFRHGPKSEPATSDDLRLFVQRKVQATRKEWLHGVKKVVTAPIGSKVAILPREVHQNVEGTAVPIKIVTDPLAPAYRHVNPNATHPFRQKDVIAEVKSVLPAGQKFTPHEALAVRRLFKVDGNLNYHYKPLFAPPQYSQQYIDWLKSQITTNPSFIQDCRSKFRDFQMEQKAKKE